LEVVLRWHVSIADTTVLFRALCSRKCVYMYIIHIGSYSNLKHNGFAETEDKNVLANDLYLDMNNDVSIGVMNDRFLLYVCLLLEIKCVWSNYNGCTILW